MYGFTENDPSNFVDPYGEMKIIPKLIPKKKPPTTPKSPPKDTKPKTDPCSPERKKGCSEAFAKCIQFAIASGEDTADDPIMLKCAAAQALCISTKGPVPFPHGETVNPDGKVSPPNRPPPSTPPSGPNQ